MSEVYVTSNVSVQSTASNMAGGFCSSVCQAGTVNIINCYSEAFVYPAFKCSGGFLGTIQSGVTLIIQNGLSLFLF